MLKDITLGQYFPGDTIIHRLDPRTKILTAVLYMTALFSADNIWGYAAAAGFIIICTYLSKVSVKALFKGMKPLVFLLVITGMINLFFTDGTPIFSWYFIKITDNGIRAAVQMFVRILLLVSGTSLLTFTTSPLALTDALESLLAPLKRIKLPVHELAMMMSIALRFIPTLIEETEKIISAQKSRGADFESGGIIKRANALIPILIPLFISAFRRADELATAMECRLYRGGEGRTRLNELKMHRCDVYALLIMTAFCCAVCVFG